MDSFLGIFSTSEPCSLVVLAGPSGVGKGTLIQRLMEAHPKSFGFSVSHTTREPREGEIDGIHYHFTKRESMERSIEEAQFVEHADVHGNLYGTSRQAVDAVTQQGKVCILDIDVQGVRKVKAANLQPPPRFVFILPPEKPTHIEALEVRLRKRGTETEEKLQRRLSNAADEIAYAQEGNGANFDKVIVNDDLDAATKELFATLNRWIPGGLA